LRDTDGILRLAAALNERYGKLDILIGNAALGASSSPLDHFEPKEWDNVLAINVTANWHLIRSMDALLKRSDAGRAVFLTSGAAANPKPYRGLYAISKAGLETLARTYAAETASTPIRVNLFNPGPTRTRMRAAVMPGEDPMTLPSPDEVAETIVPLCSPDFNETGKLYDFPTGKLLSFRAPA
jgi:NAD(P)-dependent dehydrogenase (short-subunit alcohol dehydrogenase family)